MLIYWLNFTILNLLQIDGNPFAFSLGAMTESTSNNPPRKQMDRKEWKKLKKSYDIQHTNDKLSTCNGTGATVINSVETEGLTTLTSINSLSYPSPLSNRSNSTDLKRIDEEGENRSRGSSFTKLDNEREELVARIWSVWRRQTQFDSALRSGRRRQTGYDQFFI